MGGLLSRWISKWLLFIVWLLSVAGSVGLGIWLSITFPTAFWAGWEAGNLAFTEFFTLVMIYEWIVRLRITHILIGPAAALFFIFQAIMNLMLVASCLISFVDAVKVLEVRPIIQVVLLLIVSLLSLSCQALIRYFPDGGNDESLSGSRSRHKELAREAALAVRYSDCPTVISFVCLVLFVGFNEKIEIGQLEVFVSGAIGFQLLFSNITFGISYALPHP